MWLGILENQSWERKIKELVKESKVRVDEEYGIRLSEKVREKKLFWKDVNCKRGGRGMCT